MVESTIQRCFEITHFRRKIQQILEFQKVENQTVQLELRELISSIDDGYVPCILFVIQMGDVHHFEPNRITDPTFSDTLKEAKDAGVNVLAYTCKVTPDSLELSDPVEVLL